MSGSLSQGGRGQKPRLWNRLRKLFAAAVATTSGFYNISKRLIIAIDNRLTLAVDQQLSCHDTKPSSHTLTYTLLTFLIFLLLASLAVRFPTDKVRNFFISISSMLIGGVVFLVTRDFWRDFCRYCGLGKHTGHSEYVWLKSRNLAYQMQYQRSTGKIWATLSSPYFLW